MNIWLLLGVEDIMYGLVKHGGIIQSPVLCRFYCQKSTFQSQKQNFAEQHDIMKKLFNDPLWHIYVHIEDWECLG